MNILWVGIALWVIGVIIYILGRWGLFILKAGRAGFLLAVIGALIAGVGHVTSGDADVSLNTYLWLAGGVSAVLIIASMLKLVSKKIGLVGFIVGLLAVAVAWLAY